MGSGDRHVSSWEFSWASWIRMKNEYPNLHEIAMKFHFRFSTMYLCETAFSATTVLKTKQRNCLQLSLSIWLPLQFIPELIS